MEQRISQALVPIVDAIECMVTVLSDTREDVLLCSTVFGDYVGPGDSYQLTGPGRALPFDKVLFSIARHLSASCMLYGSHPANEILDVQDSDIAFTNRLLEAAERNGVTVIEHLVVRDGMVRFMSDTLLWTPRTGLNPDI